eukprot:234376_1
MFTMTTETNSNELQELKVSYSNMELKTLEIEEQNQSSNTQMNDDHDVNISCKIYVKITIFGFITFFIISAVWSFLTDIESPIIFTGTYGVFDAKVIDGIYCVPNTYKTKTKQKHCNDVAESMTSLNDCSMYTNVIHSDELSADYFKGFKYALVILIISSAMFSFFCVVHDFAVLYFRNNTNELKFWPSDSFSNFPLLQKLDVMNSCIMNSCFTCATQENVNNIIGRFIVYIGMILLFILLTPVFLIDVIHMLFFYPLYHCIPFRCNGLIRMSSAWISISRMLTVVCATLLIIIGCVGVDIDIESIDADNCSCTCHYVLRASQFWGLFIAAYVLLIRTVLFLKLWSEEVERNQFCLYTIRYTVPIWFTNMIQPSDPTETIVDVDIQSKLSNINFVTSNNPQPKYCQINIPQKDKTSRRFRRCILLGSIFYWGWSAWPLIYVPNDVWLIWGCPQYFGYISIVIGCIHLILVFFMWYYIDKQTRKKKQLNHDQSANDSFLNFNVE